MGGGGEGVSEDTYDAPHAKFIYKQTPSGPPMRGL
jgi:hypothetical protein